MDTPVSATLRFLTELASWVAGPAAVSELTGVTWLALPTLLVLLALPATFNYPGDKKVTAVAVSGPARISLELFLTAVAVAGSWVAWRREAAVTVTVIAIASLVAGRQRWAWMLAGDSRTRFLEGRPPE